MREEETDERRHGARVLLFSIIAFWSVVIFLLVISTADAWIIPAHGSETIMLQLEDGSVVQGTVLQPEPDVYESTLRFMNEMALPVEVPTTNGGSIYLYPTYGEGFGPVYEH